MFRHLSKVMLFLGIQAGLFWALQSYGVDQGQSHYETALAGESVEAQLATYVKSRVRPLWDTNPQVIDNALKAGEDHGLIAVLVDAFIAGPDNYLAAAYDKDRRLRTTPGERIILVGGSNVAFSMDSRILEERYGLAPVNMGLQAPLGVRFMTRHVAEYVRSGDVVVVLLEHPQMWEDPNGQSNAPANFCRICPELAWLYRPEGEPGVENAAMTWEEWKRYADREALAEFADTARSSLQQLWPEPPASDEQIAAAVITAEFERQVQPLLAAAQRRFVSLDRVYLRSGFNEYGDMTRHRREAPTGKIPGFAYDFGADQIAAVKRCAGLLNDFADHCHDVGATVYFAYPPLPRNQRTEKLAPRFEAVLQASLEFPILFPIEHSFVENDDLYDAAFHLNWKGTCKRMQSLCTGLDRVLTPQTRLSVREHIAARDRVERGALVIAHRQEQSTRQ